MLAKWTSSSSGVMILPQDLRPSKPGGSGDHAPAAEVVAIWCPASECSITARRSLQVHGERPREDAASVRNGFPRLTNASEGA
jgi:hypothetical protein